MVDRPRSRPKQASKQLFLQCVINCDEYLLPPYLTRLVVTEYRHTQWEEVHRTPYTVHRTAVVARVRGQPP